MAGYTTKWNCRICNCPQDTDGSPKHSICDKCLYPLASALCYEVLKVGLQKGIDTHYFMRRAEEYANALMQRWKND